MKRRLLVSTLILAAATLAFGFAAVASGAKLPKCAQVKCRDLGCPPDVLCASGTTVKSCADVCNGR